jgi:beta-glucuronidase
LLYPIQNNFRDIIEVTGLWQFKTDPDNIGEAEGWYNGFDSDLDIAVPGSWNEQLEEAGLLHYVGTAWYSRAVFLSHDLENKKIWLRVGSADYSAKVWVNGLCVGDNSFGFLPFEFPITDVVRLGERVEIVIRVNNELTHESIPQGITSEQYEVEDRLREETYPPARFDFSPFGGIHRPVQIITTPKSHLSRLKVDTAYSNGKGSVQVSMATEGIGKATVVVRIEANENSMTSTVTVQDDCATLMVPIETCHSWSPSDPFLYELTVQIRKDDRIVDEYSLPIGVREIKVVGNKLLLNGREIYLKGFGKHEDASVIGKGLFFPLMVKDFEMIKWIGANSFRTSHYPYAEETMFYADKKGVLVIDEVPAVSLDLRHTNSKTKTKHKEFIDRLFERDYNHPCVIMWALGNEPNLVGEEGYEKGTGRAYWKEIFAHARTLDASRPMVVPNCLRAGINDPALEFSDILCINRYYGWYEYPGRLDYALTVLEEELDALFAKYRKPLMMTEFGADTMPGMHSTSDQMFTEEYQTKMLAMYIRLLRSKEYTIGEHVWNFADFRTPQHFRRVMLNMKGVFTRDRQPKAAAFRLKTLWGADDDSRNQQSSMIREQNNPERKAQRSPSIQERVKL